MEVEIDYRKLLRDFIIAVHKGRYRSRNRVKQIAESYINSGLYSEYETITLDGKEYDIHDYLLCQRDNI